MLNKTSPTNSPIVAPPVVTSVSGSWVERPCLLETEPACCHKYSCTRKERTCPEFFQANYLENELAQKPSCARTGMCQWFLLCRAKVLERRLPCGTQSRPPSAPIDSTTGSLKGFLHNWMARFSTCWPQSLYKKDLHVWLGRKEYLYLTYWRNCSRTVNPCENLAPKCCQDQWLCCYLPCQCQSMSNSFLPYSM